MPALGTAGAGAGHDAAAGNGGRRRICSRAELVAAMHAVAKGDEAAFATVYAATAAKLFGIIVRIVRRRDVAEDVLQEVYLRIWQQAHSFDARFGSPITWMVTIARHRALDEVRRKDAGLSLEDCPEVFRLAAPTGSLAGEEDNAGRALTAGLQRLSRDQRSMLVEAYCYGLSRQEIARRTGRPVPTVKTWLRRALAELRVYLTEQETTTPVAPSCLTPAIDEKRALPPAKRLARRASPPPQMLRAFHPARAGRGGTDRPIPALG
jgi:RNA polymerase sigma-70 factor (ECF subfamily)